MGVLRWKGRATRLRSAAGTRRIFESDGPYRVTHIRYRAKSLADKWRAEVLDELGWQILSKHRDRGPAMRACEAHARGSDPHALVAAAIARELKPAKRSL